MRKQNNPQLLPDLKDGVSLRWCDEIDPDEAMIMDPEVCQWIERFGFSAVKSMGLRSRIKDRENKEAAIELKRFKHKIINRFKVGSVCSRQEIKNILSNWGIKNPKATDITNYLEVHPARINKLHGFRIIGIKED